jgi:hypothetical protein
VAAQETCYTRPVFSLFDLFGRSAAVKALDHALREAGLHPLLVPEAVKLTILQLQKKKNQGTPSSTRQAEHDEAARLLAFCMLGREQFIESNDLAAADRVEERFEAAITAGDSPDAKIILLALHAGLIAPDIADRIDVEGR